MKMLILWNQDAPDVNVNCILNFEYAWKQGCGSHYRCAHVEIIAWVLYSILIKINSPTYSEDFGSPEAEHGCWEQNPYISPYLLEKKQSF